MPLKLIPEEYLNLYGRETVDYFNKKYKPKELIAFSDISWGEDELYKDNSFKQVGIEKPKIKKYNSYEYYNCGKIKYKFN